MKYRVVRKRINKTKSGKDAYGILATDLTSGQEVWLNILKGDWGDRVTQGQEIDVNVKPLGKSLWIDLPRQDASARKEPENYKNDTKTLSRILMGIEEIKELLKRQRGTYMGEEDPPHTDEDMPPWVKD